MKEKDYWRDVFPYGTLWEQVTIVHYNKTTLSTSVVREARCRQRSVFVLEHDGDDRLALVTWTDVRFEMDVVLLVVLGHDDPETDGIGVGVCAVPKDVQ